MIEKKLFAALGVMLLGAGLMGAPVLAKCHKDCKHAIIMTFHSCKQGCAKGKTGVDCRKACKTTKNASLKTCKAASNPTPPTCSPSGAFLDESSF